MNIGGSPTTATFTFRTTANTTVTATLWLPAQGRATLYANAVPGLSAASFRTTVTASEPIVVERAMYWPGSSGSSSAMASGASEGLAAGAAAPVLVGDPEADAVVDAATLAERQAAFPYVLTPVEPVDAASQARAAGTISPEEQAQLDSVAKARTSFLKKAPPGTQSGVAPPVFLAPTTAASSSVSGGATTTAIALPWHGGFLVLGRLQ